MAESNEQSGLGQALMTMAKIGTRLERDDVLAFVNRKHDAAVAEGNWAIALLYADLARAITAGEHQR